MGSGVASGASGLGIMPLLVDIGKAIDEAQAKHGPLTDEPVRATAILIREAGEAVDAALRLTSPVQDANRDVRGQWKALYDELAQVAATAMTIMDGIRGVAHGK